MSKNQLIEVFRGFSEIELADMLLAKIRELFFAGDWGSANAIINYVLAEVDNVEVRSRAAGFGVFAAVRARDVRLALARRQQLLDLPECDGKAGLTIESLEHLADMLLPEQCELLVNAWLQTTCLDKSLQEKYAKIGVALWRNCVNNPALRQVVGDALQKRLPAELVAREGERQDIRFLFE